MERDIINQARKEKEKLVAQFYTDVVGQINDQLQLVCSSVLENLDEHAGVLRGPVSQQLRNLVTQLEGLNFMQDSRIEDMLADIQAALPSETERREAAKGLQKIDTTRLQTVLRRVQAQAKTAVIDLGMTPSQRRARSGEVLTSEGLLSAVSRKHRPGQGFSNATSTGTKRKRRTTPAIS